MFCLLFEVHLNISRYAYQGIEVVSSHMEEITLHRMIRWIAKRLAYTTPLPHFSYLRITAKKNPVNTMGRGRAEVAVPRCDFSDWFSTTKTGSGREV